MYVVISIVAVLLIISLMVIVHELGHFITAKRFGVGVLEFAIGLPPRIASIRRGGTDYSLNALPLGGYVSLVGEDDPALTNSLASKPPWKRAVILLSGSTMNFVLAILLFAATFVLGVDVPVPSDEVVIQAVVAGSPAAQAGLLVNDAILRVDAKTVKTTSDLQSYALDKAGQGVTLVIKRNGEVLPPVPMTPRANPPEGEGPMGIQIANYRMVIERYPAWEALGRGAQNAFAVVGITLLAPVMVMKGLMPADQARPVGPVGITQITGNVVSQIPTTGWVPVLNLIALLSTSLAVVNVLPFPGLDGGRMVFVVLEWLRRGKRVSPQREGMIHFAGLMFLFGLMILITYFDVVNPVKIPGAGTP
jgi:regulator of sigma E protease